MLLNQTIKVKAKKDMMIPIVVGKSNISATKFPDTLDKILLEMMTTSPKLTA